MDQNLDILSMYFGGGSAEEESDILNQVFVRNNDFKSIVMPPKRTVRLLVGSKGSGKSAVLQYWHTICAEKGVPSILLTPTLVEVESSEDQDNRKYTQNIYKALVNEIGIKVGSELSGFLTDEEKKLVDDATRAGARTQSATEKMLKALMCVGKAVSSIDFNELLPHPSNETRGSVNTINQHFGMNNGKLFYVLFDDIDQFGNAGSPKYLDRIWCAVLAFRMVVQQLPNVRAIVTMRNEIWRQICNRENNGRDQVDHVRPWIINLAPTESDMSKILRRRLERCKTIAEKENGIKYDNVFQPFFDGKRCKLPSSEDTRPWESFILKSSRDRPRDSVQLIDLMVRDAKQKNDNRICNRNVENIAEEYSRQRIDDLCNENRDLCPELEKVLLSFSSIYGHDSISFELEAEDIRQHLLHLPGTGIYIQGIALRPENIVDMFKLWALLYQLGFINARTKDINGTDGYRHIEYRDDPSLVGSSRWNEMQAARWEIHPCYRSYLLKRSKDKRNMLYQRKKEKNEARDNSTPINIKGTKHKRKKRKRKKNL